MNASESWLALLGAAIGTNARLLELEPNIHSSTLPRVENTEEGLRAFEAEFDERLPPGYRDFLLFADGWEAFYFGMGIFGIPELRGGGNWSPAQELLRTYDDEEVLETIGIDPRDVIPIAAGQRLNLIVVYRSGTATPGRVVWIDSGEELARFDDFQECFRRIVSMKQRHLDRVDPADFAAQ
ncbi:SMI1/KNR4 family protein [Glycomyces harbinensis]|uniref:SMI1 / KNR4 family (SUKH-1) n=1 Tax=Glycomyces harbinensis TaxID=58114 RepID=A0A1G6Y5W9_9ACTN|nr:SMI1/KNR4 family protein [Glycomyces harbinensis]SDD85682.1 SMI1 / KNR4 family (SUKH-1) [Glycomyces harbinensis]